MIVCKSLKQYIKNNIRKFLIIISIFFFVYGIFFIKYKVFPYKTLSYFYHKVLKYQYYNYKNIEVLDELFTEKTIDKNLLIFKPVEDVEDFYTYINNLFIPISFDSLYENIEILSDSLFKIQKLTVAKINFKYKNKICEAYSYVNNENSDTAWFILPGSDPNQSTAIITENMDNYHYGLYSKIKNRFKTYIYIKPNEDILAWHNNEKKINGNAYYYTILNWGGSYPFSCLVQSIALVKYISLNSKCTIVSGLSQGGYMALLNSIYTKPQIAIISSGYSPLNDSIYVSGFDQFIIPGAYYNYNFYKLKDIIRNTTSTKFLFTYGKNDYALYRSRRTYFQMLNHFKGFNNVSIETFEGGHQYPVNLILDWVSK